MEFHIHNLQNPYGPPIFNISGKLPVFFTSPTAPPPLETPSAQSAIQSHLRRLRELFEDEEDSTIQAMIEQYLILGSYFLNHRYTYDTPEAELMLDNVIGIMKIGGANQSLEYADNCSEEIDIGYKNIVRRINGISELMGDEDDMEEGFSSFVLMVPILENEILFYKKQIKKLLTCRPDATNLKGQLTKDIMGKSTTMLLLLDSDETQDFSDATFRRIQSQINGSIGSIEIAGILRNLEIPPEIRVSFIWDIIRSLFISVTSQLMDLFKLKQAFHDPKPQLTNSILRRVIREGQNLESSIHTTIQNIQVEFHDLKVGIRKGRKYFESDENVQEYFDLIEFYWDGLVQGFAHEKFSGTDDYKWLGLRYG